MQDLARELRSVVISGLSDIMLRYSACKTVIYFNSTYILRCPARGRLSFDLKAVAVKALCIGVSDLQAGGGL